MKISEVLERASDLLWDGTAAGLVAADDREEYICHAIARVSKKPFGQSNSLPASQFLAQMGMPLGGAGFCRAASRRGVKGRLLTQSEEQGIRYAWLQLAAQVAREEGL